MPRVGDAAASNGEGCWWVLLLVLADGCWKLTAAAGRCGLACPMPARPPSAVLMLIVHCPRLLWLTHPPAHLPGAGAAAA